MERYLGTDNLTLRRSAVAIGVFDGVHLGHQAVLNQVTAFASATHAQTESKREVAVALTFDIHPSRLLAPAYAPATISTLDQQIALMERYGGGLDAVVTIPFTHEFASLSPDAFVQDILIAKLGVRHIFIGSDFRYGEGRVGNVDTLREEGERLGFGVTIVAGVEADGDRVSSTRIRSLIAAGELYAAIRLLGHPFAIAGRVVPGKQLGRELGYPTANVNPLEANQLLPLDGVYAGYASLATGECYRAAVSVGTNPTTDTDAVRKVEAYIMDGFSAEIYNSVIEIDFRHFLRGQLTFDGLVSLKAQIAADVASVEALLPTKPY